MLWHAEMVMWLKVEGAYLSGLRVAERVAANWS